MRVKPPSPLYLNSELAKNYFSTRSMGQTLAQFSRADDSRVKVRYTNGKTALHVATENNNLTRVKKLLSLQDDDVNARDCYGSTPLHYAAQFNEYESHLKVAKLLLKHEADVNARNKDGLTPLWYLVRYPCGSVEFAELFLNFQADVHVMNKAMQTLLFPAVVIDDNVQVLQLLINQGLDINHRSKTGYTPLQHACDSVFDNIKIIKCLLNNGANVNELEYSPPTLSKAILRGTEPDSKITKKRSRFVIEHIDFDVNRNDVNVLRLRRLRDKNYSLKMILRHVAKLEALEVPVHPDFLDKISEIEECRDYYDRCKAELLRAKVKKLPDSWVTFFNLLVDGRKKLKNYAGNSNLIRSFRKSGYGKKFPIYGREIEENVDKSVKRRKLYDKSCVFLSNCLPIFNADHLIVRDILDCIMSKKDLSKLREQTLYVDRFERKVFARFAGF